MSSPDRKKSRLCSASSHEQALAEARRSIWLREGQQDVAPGRATERQLHSVTHSIVGGNDEQEDEAEEDNEDDDDDDEEQEEEDGEWVENEGENSTLEHRNNSGEATQIQKKLQTLVSGEQDREHRMESADKQVMLLLIENLRATVLSLGSSRGNRTVEEQTMLDCISAAVMSPQLVDLRLMSAVSRSVGLSRRQQTRGLGLRKLKEEQGSLVLRVPRAPHSFGSKAKTDLDWVYDWFHDECNLVEVDKSKRNAYRRKVAKVAGKIRRLACQRRVMTGTKQQLVSAFISSDVYSNYKSRTGLTLGERTVKGCICPCIKEATLLDCVCPMCVEFRYLLKAWHKQRQVWHQTTPCRCSGCRGPRWVSRLQLISNNNSCGMFKCACKIPFRIFMFSSASHCACCAASADTRLTD